MSKTRTLFVVWAFFFQILLIMHFALRKWSFDVIKQYGWLFYLLGIPALIISVVILLRGESWSFWLGGILQFIWSIYGYYIEIVKNVTKWRNPIQWSVAGPYVILYLSTIMFYWWPLGQIKRVYWYIYSVLFLVSTYLNITSH